MPISSNKRRRGGKMFGLEFSKAMNRRHLSQAELARRLNVGGVVLSKQFIGYLVHSRRLASLDTVDALVSCMQCLEDEAVRMHRAAALDAGYRIGDVL